jgi:hypothetical protein
MARVPSHRPSVTAAVLGVLLAACAAPETGRGPRFGLAGSAVPNLGVEGALEIPVGRRGDTLLAADLHLVQQFLDDEDLADDGNPEAGDWTQAGLALRAITDADDEGHWTFRVGPEWFEARSNPNIVDEPGHYVGLRVGLGFERDLTPGVSMGPEVSFLLAWGEGTFEWVPQLVWGLRWGANSRPRR